MASRIRKRTQAKVLHKKVPMRSALKIIWAAFIGVINLSNAQEATITVHADQVPHRVSRYLTGACLEDVNHEVYGGIDSQMIFGESFAEPVPPPAVRGFNIYEGRWTPERDGSIRVAGGAGPKLVSEGPVFAQGETSVELRFAEKGEGNAGLIVKVNKARNGADQFDGYEVSLESSGTLVLGRHRQNWEPLRRVPCDVPLNEWIKLAVRLNGNALEVLVNDKIVTQYDDIQYPLAPGMVGLRTWQRDVSFRNFSVSTGGQRQELAFELAAKDGWGDGVSGMWRALRRGDATGVFSQTEVDAFSGKHSQRIVFTSGSGEIGIENQGLNRQGMNFIKGKTYEGYIYVRATNVAEVSVAIESRTGAKIYAEKRLLSNGGGWQRLDFTLKSNDSDSTGRFAIKLKQPGAITVGYAFLQPGAWGRFKGLPVRKDVAEGLIDQGITVLRYGGCMANAEQYRWKKMIGPRAQRPPYAGWWYPHASNGWGIFDFMNFCEAAGFLAIPDVNMSESPQDMADFMEYVNGPADSAWGRRRATDGHLAPYGLKYLQLGNEEQVNEDYWQKFKPLAEAIWAKDPDIILVVGDFAYRHQINDPFNFTGADGRITSLAAHQKILQLAKQHDREVWFDVHVWTDGPRPESSLPGALSFLDALDRIAAGAKHKVVVFELNANNHSQRRALANALAVQALQRDGRVPIVASANGLQPDGQNDNGWDQGLLFVNPAQVWHQPPGYVIQMISRSHQPLSVESMVQGADENLSVTATRSEDGKTLVLQVVNAGARLISANLELTGFAPRRATAQVQLLAATLDAQNSAQNPASVQPQRSEWRHGLRAGRTICSFQPHSFTVIRFQ